MTSTSERFRLHRAGVLNVWQYDEQEFAFADGRLLLRGANGAGKSKTLEMLLPFALDGDKARITASAKHHTSLLWLMTDGYEGQARVGYVWVEFLRTGDDGREEALTCGVGIRASASARTATAWHFTTGRRVGHDLALEDDGGPLSRPRLEETLGADGQVFEKAAAYKEHVGRTLFGLDPSQYDEVLRLLYWLRQPQVGEDIEPVKLAEQLSQALPQLDEQAVRSAGDTFDELTAFGEQIERRSAAAEALGVLAEAYAGYARAAVADRARTVRESLRVERARRREVKAADAAVTAARDAVREAEKTRDGAAAGSAADRAALRVLEESPEFRDQRRLGDLADLADRDAAAARKSEERRARQAADAESRAVEERRWAGEATTALRAHAEGLRALDRRLREAVPGAGLPVPATLDEGDLTTIERAGPLTDALARAGATIEGARTAVRRRAAGLGLVREALAGADRAADAQRQAEREAEQAERRWERAREARIEAERAAETEHDALSAALTAWASGEDSPGPELPGELTDETVAELPALASVAASAPLEELRDSLADAAGRRRDAGAEIERLTAERARVAAERDPAPPAPPLPRTGRPDGAPLWRVVDFADGLADADRAGVEAALQSAGLLDAWVRPGGRLLDADQCDVVLSGAGVAGDSLASLLTVDLPPDAGLRPKDVRRVLAAIGARPDSAATAWVSADGSWRLGPAHGRAAKERAQYVGATARVQERERRLRLLDDALAAQRELFDAADRDHRAHSAAIAALEAWVRAVPSGQALQRAWTALAVRLEQEGRDEAENRAAQGAAHAARAAAAQAREELGRVAAEHNLPTDRGRLDSIEQELRGLETDLREAAGRERPLNDRIGRWRDAVAERDRATAALAAETTAAVEAARQADDSRTAWKTLHEAVGESVQELERRVQAVKRSLAGHEDEQRRAAQQVQDLGVALGAADADARNALTRLEEHLAGRAGALAALVEVGAVPGLLDAAGVGGDDASLIMGLAVLPPNERVPRSAVAATERLAALSDEDATVATTRVWRAAGEAASGPAADHQPAVATFGELLAVSGRDDAGEAAVVDLARRVSAAVERDRGLLTEREKKQFEQHVLGELGDAIRRCRRDADELVAAMNEQLSTVTTSQGIRVRLQWRLRDDVPAEARAAVELLAQPVGALIPEEREGLRDSLHRLIEASRAERPELSYGEHLAAALDYRTWSEFTIRYTRPERAGTWERLHRRSPLSQGEQKVLCYLPLFAAASAHFTSLAGAAPYAPRLVLLDDAFPKIDVRTHPLLFGLLVQLDLDFVVTSERLWGDHDTMPSLAIYEALRDPGQRGIAQYEYRWDGRVLQSVG